ncbi:MAG: WbqC family protein, partial [Bacteroidota bacterium]
NRCYINTVQGKQALIVPLTSKHGKVKITDVRIDHTQKWLNNHWRTIQSAYGNSPFFEHYGPDLQAVLFKKYDFLYDMNFHLLTLCLKWLECSIPVRESLAYETEIIPPVQDLRSVIRPKIDTLGKIYLPVPYRQVFGNMFVENLSLIDLIFCEGPGAWGVVKASAGR